MRSPVAARNVIAYTQPMRPDRTDLRARARQIAQEGVIRAERERRHALYALGALLAVAAAFGVFLWWLAQKSPRLAGLYYLRIGSPKILGENFRFHLIATVHLLLNRTLDWA